MHRVRETVTVREFEPPDQAVARALVLEGLGEHFGFVDESLNPDLDDIASSYLSAGHAFLIAERQGEIVGTAGLQIESPSDGRIHRMSVRKELRRHGIANMLLVRLLEIAKARALRNVFASTNADWPDAIAFYESKGFVAFRRTEHGVHFRLSL